LTQFDTDLDDLLSRHQPSIAKLARRLIGAIRDMRPDMKPKVQRGWNSVTFTHPAAGYVCAVVAQAKEHNVLLVFAYGKLLSSPLLIDNGLVKQVRWIPFVPGRKLPLDDIGILLVEAIALRT
jgi:hypothetical protein